jgi:glycosyltransferase involved in cell wall biosynthesis
LVSEGSEGYIVKDPLDEEALADRIRRLLDAKRRHEMGRAARNLAERNSWERNCQRVLDLYDELTTRRRLAA